MVPAYVETERLMLRPARVGDAPAVFSYASDPVVSRFLPWQPHEDVSETEAFLRRCEGDWDEGGSFPWVIVHRDSEAVVGMIEANVTGHRASLGYVLARPSWGHGIATEAVRAVVEVLLEDPEIWRVWATCDVENAASARVLEKAGMSREGLLHRWDVHNVAPEPRDTWVYAIWRE